MIIVEILLWAALSIGLAVLHMALTKGRHGREILTAATAGMWGVSGGLAGSMLRLHQFGTGRFDTVAFGMAVAAALVYLFLEFAGSHVHPVGPALHR